ncbi:3D domain-containing protein [Pseudobdellovibrio sp. HCB154]|uniref:3D domain-containing protein n=1 Tax=Pseudobdellovibrio sp. HCB154 TaxID=3386277 RepID=UPI00391718F2
MKKLSLALIFMNIFLLLGCGGGSDSSKSKRYARTPKKVLSEAEKAKYITPTIYHVADYSSLNVSQCSEKTEISLRKSKDNFVKVPVCRKAFKGCALQGSCYIQVDGQKTMINYHKKVNGVVQFMLVDRSVCKHGLGDSSDKKQSFKTMCLDPFYSVAADTDIYPLGAVVYIPAVRGASLPDGSVHDGYFVVRDTGGGIDGRGRFDFFTGDVGLNASNPFSNLGLGGESNFDYFIVSGSEAQSVRERRAFPLLK